MRRFTKGAGTMIGLIGALLALFGPLLAALFGPGGDANLAVGGVLVGSGLALVALSTLGFRLARGSRHRRAAERMTTTAAPRSAYMEGSTPVALVDNQAREGWPSRRDGMYEFEADDTTIIVADDAAWVGPSDEWRIHVSSKAARLESGGAIIATATRPTRTAREWSLDAAPHSYRAVIEQTRSKESSSERTYLFYRDVTRHLQRQATISRTSGGAPVAHIDLTYNVREHPQFGKRNHRASFAGTINVTERVPFAVAVLTLRLALSDWAKRTPKVGEWATSGGD